MKNVNLMINLNWQNNNI